MRAVRPVPFLVLLVLAGFAAVPAAAGPRGYYREPAVHGDTIVFVAEGDLWKAPLAGGTATRLTSHPGSEGSPAISPDGRTVAFTASYEGPTEVYVMPIDGGRPVRLTWSAARGTTVSGWTPDGRVLIRTSAYSTLPNAQLLRVDPAAGRSQAGDLLPLAQAADGAFGPDGTLYFARLPFQGSHTKRYRGGTAETLWRFRDGDPEATPLTADYPGTSKRPMWWNGRVYFATDRDGIMNLWSMAPDGTDLVQHTRHPAFEVRSPSMGDGRIVYQLGADLRVLDVATGEDREIDIALDTDLDHTREHWIEEPMDWLTAAHVAHDGTRVALTARGLVFTAPRKQGRIARVTPGDGVRWREARFLPEGKAVVALGDGSGEVEVWRLPADGVGEAERLTDGADVLRWEALPSPDGKRIAHRDKNFRLWIHDVAAGEDRLVVQSDQGDLGDLTWSPDSRWLAFTQAAPNSFVQVWVHDTNTGTTTAVTTARFNSYAPAWSPDGKWLYLLSDRRLVSIVPGPWGAYQPEPYLDRTTRVYHLPLKSGERSPWAPETELDAAKPDAGGTDGTPAKAGDAKGGKGKGGKAKEGDAAGDAKDGEKVVVEIDLDGIAARLREVPIPPGNYSGLTAGADALFFLSRPVGAEGAALVGVKVARRDVKVETLAEKVDGYEMSGDGKTLLVRIGKALHLADAKPAKIDAGETRVDLSGWKLSVDPRREWRQMFVEAWRLERDYFYDRAMHGVDWPAMLERYLPLVDRVTDREELSDAMSQMVAELSALHIFVRGGDLREGDDRVVPASLGAVLARDEAAGGYRVEHVWAHDPDEPDRAAPLARPGVDVREGDVLVQVNGVALLDVPDPAALLRQQAGRQVRVRVRPADGGPERDVIVEPFSPAEEADLRYHEWEHTRRLRVEERGAGRIGYVHLRAMGGGNFTEWAKGFYPVFDREGLIVDVRHNRGGNIDSWILGRLMRKAWFAWSQRIGTWAFWNQQYAFRGHVAVLCNERTASDGEAFAEGFRRLGLGKVIGTRTWGGEIWLSSSNVLVDNGIASAAEFGVYGPEGTWLIEGWGVEPDIVVDNPPHATFRGEDAQLDAAVDHLLQRIEEEPIPELAPPAYPDKSFRNGPGADGR